MAAAPFAACLVLAALGCEPGGGEPAAAARTWPEGAVLALNDEPILAEDVDRIGSDYALLEPQDSLNQLRQLAFARTILPLVAARGIDPARREKARALAESYRASLLAGEMPSGPLAGPMEIQVAGDFRDLGFDFWRTALTLEPGVWSEILETPGSFHLLRVAKREEGSLPSLTRFTIGLFHFPYLDEATAAADVDAAIGRSRLAILDETWRYAVPAALRYRLHAENP